MEENITNIVQFFRPGGILPALLVLVCVWGIGRLVSEGFERMGARFTAYRLSLHQAKSIIRLVLYLAGIVAAVPLVFSLSDQALLALGGALVFAVGLSMRDLVASVIAGITILIDKPFQVGDRITYGETYGEVREIGLRTVRVVTLDDNVVTIPNNKFLTDVVASGNAGALDMMVQMDFYIGLDEEVGEAKSIVAEALASSRFAYLKKPWAIVVSEVRQNDFVAVRLRAKVYVFDVQYQTQLETDVTERVLAAFKRAGVAGPSVLHRAIA